MTNREHYFLKCRELEKENEQLKFELKECREHKLFSRRELEKENEQLKQSFINLIDKKIEEFKNGDYGDLPCNTIHMFLDLKEELSGDVE